MDSKSFKIVYGVALPITVIILLLGFASYNSRLYLLGSIVSDLIIRILLSIWFCGLYIQLSRISTFSYYPHIKWTKADVGRSGKYFYRGMSLFFGAGGGLITWWAIQWFLPGLLSFAYVIAAVNSLIIIFPLVTHYWVLKL